MTGLPGKKITAVSYIKINGERASVNGEGILNNEKLGMRNKEFFRKRIWAHFFARARAKKPGFPLQFLSLPAAGLRDFRFNPLRIRFSSFAGNPQFKP
jgi:hypothetical protein